MAKALAFCKSLSYCACRILRAISRRKLVRKHQLHTRSYCSRCFCSAIYYAYVVFIGGILSLLLALVFYDILGNNTNVIVIGICEELAKVIAVIYFVRNLK